MSRVRAYTIALTCTLIFASFWASNAQDRFIFDSKLFVDGVEFIVKGVDYSPCPLGFQTNAGLCSYKMSPYGWAPACYDSDYFDSSPWLSTDPSIRGFQALWDRDFPNIVATGANAIRIYNANPTTWAASQIYRNIIPSPTGKDHTLFMSYCDRYNLKIIFPLIMDNTLFDTNSEAVMKRYHRWQIDEVGNYSALLMWQLGNEQEWTWQQTEWQNPVIYGKVNDYIDYAKRYTYSKWGRRIPVSFALQNTLTEYVPLMSTTHIDVLSINVFEGGPNPTKTAWTQVMTYEMTKGTQNFVGFAAATCMYSKAVLVTEFGWTYTNGLSNKYPQGEINRYWNHLVTHLDASGLIGGLYFEFTDEPSLGKDQGVYGLSTGYHGSNSSMGSNQLVADQVYARTTQLNDLVSGTWGGKLYNFQSNVFNLLGRSPVQYSPSLPDRCPASSYLACPGNTIPVCNGNGMCDRTKGTCTCGTGWTGSDCSQPVCPGSPVCSGRGICSTLVSPPECFCNVGYYGLSCQSQPVPGSCPGGGNCTNGNGVCNNSTWTCACWPGWTGLDCAVTDLKGLSLRATSSSASTLSVSSSTVGVTSSTSAVSSAAVASSSTVSAASTTSVASVTSTGSVSASTSGTIAATTTGSTSATLAATSTASTSAVAASSTVSVSASTTKASSTSATLAASSTSSVSASVSTAATFAASTGAVSTSNAATTTTVAATSTGSTSATVSAASTTSTASTSAKVSTTAKSTTSSTASTANQLATSSVSLQGATATVAFATSSTVAAVTSSSSLSGSSTASASEATSTSSASTAVGSLSATTAQTASTTAAQSLTSSSATAVTAAAASSTSSIAKTSIATTSTSTHLSSSSTTSSGSKTTTTSASSTVSGSSTVTGSSTATGSSTVSGSSTASSSGPSTVASSTRASSTSTVSSTSGSFNKTSTSSTSGHSNFTSSSSGSSNTTKLTFTSSTTGIHFNSASSPQVSALHYFMVALAIVFVVVEGAQIV